MEKRVFTVRKTFSKGSLYLTEVAICGETEFPVFSGIFDIKGQDERAQYIRNGSGEQDGASFELYSGQFIHNGSNSKKTVMNIN